MNILDKLRLKHEGDMVSTGLILWRKGWFKNSKETGCKLFRKERIAKFIGLTTCCYTAKLMILVQLLAYFIGQNSFVDIFKGTNLYEIQEFKDQSFDQAQDVDEDYINDL